MTSPDKIWEIIQNKGVIPGTWRHKRWFTTSYSDELVFIVVNETWRYFIRIIIFDKPQKWGHGNLQVFVVSKHTNLDEAKEKAKRLENELEKIGQHIENTIWKIPVLAFLKEEWSDENVKNVIRQGTWEHGLWISVDNPDNYLRPFDILEISRSLFGHSAIYLGRGRVCHFAGNKMGSSNSGGMKVKKDSLRNFFEGENRRFVRVVRPVVQFKSKDTIKNNISKAISGSYGEEKYDTLSNNCEHFANLIILGIRYSGQSCNFNSFRGDWPINLKKEICSGDDWFDYKMKSGSNFEEISREIEELTQETSKESYGDWEARIEVKEVYLSNRCKIQ